MPEFPGRGNVRLERRFATDTIAEFARGHTPSDILRELVQNEYDAEGSDLELDFDEDTLTVRGNGQHIGPDGWRRLSVMMGTGVVDAGGRIERKVNGIGSKNFGLRSLFLFGDWIEVRSGGRCSYLHREDGASPEPLDDPGSSDVPGVVIQVPYRKAPERRLRLPAFDLAYEREVVDSMGADVGRALVKLASPSAARSLRSVRIRSSRLGTEVVHTQRARRHPSLPGVVSRSSSTRRSDPGGAVAAESWTETEYQAVLLPPAGLARPEIPGYFRMPRGRIQLGVSVRTLRGRLDFAVPGCFYYPLGALQSRTGLAISVSAPFEMDPDRSALVDVGNSPWNEWLVQATARCAVKALRNGLFASHRAEAYRALDTRHPERSTVPAFVEAVARLLRSEAVWPTAAPSRRQGYAPIGQLTVPGSPALAEVVSAVVPARGVLNSALARDRVCAELAEDFGAHVFSVNSLVRLRCLGLDSPETPLDAVLEWAPPSETPETLLADVGMQARIAAALDRCAASIQPHHRYDLRRAPTTMTAAGTLGAPEDLWVVHDPAVASVLPPTTVLHPELVEHSETAGLCNRHNTTKWVVRTSRRLVGEAADEAERAALALHVRNARLSREAARAASTAPILLDTQGRWTAPADLVLPSTDGVALVAAAVHVARRKDAADRALRQLRFGRKLGGGDVVDYAALVETGQVSPREAAEALARLHRLLRPSDLGRLKSVGFVAVSTGEVVVPPVSYVRSPRTLGPLGEHARYVVDLAPALAEKLGCRVRPLADDIVAGIAVLRESRSAPASPAAVQNGLLEALAAERRPLASFRDVPVLWTGAKWEAPGECLVGADHSRTFSEAVTVLGGDRHSHAARLGAPVEPTVDHWRRLLLWADGFAGAQPVPQRVAQALRQAYLHLGGPPEDLQETARYLLDDTGRLHSRQDALARRFLLNDDVPLAAAAREAQVEVAFAEAPNSKTRVFLEAAGAVPLSSAAGLTGTYCGPESAPRESLDLDGLSRRVQGSDFVSALAALASSVSPRSLPYSAAEVTRRLAPFARLATVDYIHKRYRLAGCEVAVAVGWALVDGDVVLAEVRRPDDLNRAAARAVAETLDPAPSAASALRNAVYCLLRCRTSRDLQRELSEQNVHWLPGSATSDVDEEIDEAGRIVDELVAQLLPPSPPVRGDEPDAVPVAPLGAPRPEPPPSRPLPPIETVSAVLETESYPPTPHSPGFRGSGGGWWLPPTESERQQELLLGERGEHVVFDLERQRVGDLGLDPNRVVWVSREREGADHDIASVDENGEPLWIEVKSTSGRDGKFTWTAGEFWLAVRERGRYVLYRVYEADTTSPKCRPVPDPVGLLVSGGLQLDLDRLRGDVGTLKEDD